MIGEKRRLCTLSSVVLILTMIVSVVVPTSLVGPNVCVAKQKYNITKRVKYRAPMSIRTYEWCLSIPPRCSKWSIELRDLTRLETEERTAETVTCCPGYKIQDITCVPICPNGKTGADCSYDCPYGKWGPNCVNQCQDCNNHGNCSPVTGRCVCDEEWRGERCDYRMPTTTSTTTTTTLRPSRLTSTKTPVTISGVMDTLSTVTVKPNDSQTTNPVTATEVITANTIPTVVTASSTYETTALQDTLNVTNITTNLPAAINNTDIQIDNEDIELTTIQATTEIKTTKIETTTKTFTTPKLKSKEIWIKPAQKDLENQTIIRHKNDKENGNTTRTIKVSILPSSISYYVMPKKSYNSEVTKPMTTTSAIETETEISTGDKTINTEKPVITNSMQPTPSTALFPTNEKPENPNVTILVPKNQILNTTKLYRTLLPDWKLLTDPIEPFNLRKKDNEESITTVAEFDKTHEDINFLTEPEQITANNIRKRTSVDLISIISIAIGVMMAVITLAIIIVMVERCKRDRYEEVRKMEIIRMESNEMPPPYTRSIFHAPLPEPPAREKCHYQPISTLDRKVKQFMRPVVVQSISPIMIENFRGILECHYDHIPQRNRALDTDSIARSSLAPSVSTTTELLYSRTTSMTDSSFETLKREAKFQDSDFNTEPLYAEIPFWKQIPKNSFEDINTEAVTEL